MDQWMTVDQAALRLGVSPWSIRRWVRLGILPAARVGQRGPLRIRPADLDGMLRPVVVAREGLGCGSQQDFR